MHISSLSLLNTQQSFGSNKIKRVLSEATKAKISASLKGITPSEETRKKISASLKGITRSEETKQKLSKAAKGRILSPEHKANLSKAMKAIRQKKPEISQLHQNAQKLLWDSDEGKIIKAAIHKQFENQPIAVKKAVYKNIAHKKLSDEELASNKIFWNDFWKDNPDILALYKEASKKAYEKIKKK